MARGKWIGATRTGFATAASLLLAACATMPLTLEDLAADPDANRLSVSRLPDGLLTVPVDVGLDAPVPFVLDTGATKSVLFDNVLDSLPVESRGAVRVHGMFGVGVVRAVSLPTIALGTTQVTDHSFAVLPQRKTDVGDGAPWGILGMDILERYRLFSPGRDDGIILLEATGRAPVVPASWSRVKLGPSPYNDAARNLRFMEVRLNGRLTPALLDTGSAINVLTYEFADFPTVRLARERQRKAHEVQGALESFRPRVLLKEVDFRAGSRVWWDQEFVVKDVDSLEALGVVGKPFMIAGVGLLTDEVYYLDIAGNELRMPKALGPANISHRIGGAEIQVGPATRSR